MFRQFWLLSVETARLARENVPMSSIRFRALVPNETPRVGEIDRTEEVRTGYRVEETRLIRMAVVWDSPPWYEQGEEHSIPQMVHCLDEVLSLNGTTLGAFADDRLVGVAALRPCLTETTAQLALLHVSNGYRRQGIATRLLDQVEQLALESGARELYVSATPSGSAVGFYTSRGFTLTPTPHPELLELEPDDIHMVKPL